MNETRGQRDITQEFSLRSKLRDIHHAHKVSLANGVLTVMRKLNYFQFQEWALLQDQQKETEEKLQELEASPPSDVINSVNHRLRNK